MPPERPQEEESDFTYVKIYRKSIKSQVFQNAELWKLFCWCIMKANYRERWVSVTTGSGQTQVHVNAGEFIFGRKEAAKELKMPQSSVRNRMEKLVEMQNLALKPDTHFSIVTVINWDSYQGDKSKEDSLNASRSATSHTLQKTEDEIKKTSKSGHKTGQAEHQGSIFSSENYVERESKEDRQEDNQRTTRGQPEDTDKKDKNVKKKSISTHTRDHSFQDDPFFDFEVFFEATRSIPTMQNWPRQTCMEIHQAMADWSASRSGNKRSDWLAVARTFHKRDSLSMQVNSAGPRPSTPGPTLEELTDKIKSDAAKKQK